MIAEDDPDPFYTSLCSSATLQSNKQGFFLDYTDHVTEIAGTKWLDKVFGRLQTNEERIKICYRDPKVKEAVHNTLRHVQELYKQKSAPISRQRRLDGSRALDAGKPEQALLLFSQSVIRAPKQGNDMSVDTGMSLPLALAARSEALLELREFELSIADIQLAIKEGFAEHLRFQLYWRMGRCYREMGHIGKARVSMQLALRILSKHQLAIGKDNVAYARTINEELTNLETCQENPNNSEKGCNKSDVTLPNLTGGPNSDLPAASACVGVSSSEGAGRFAVANTQINTGDTVVVEKPYAACLLPDMFGSHCHHCFKKLQVPVACHDCSGIAFCSTACRDEACDSYHKYECRYMDLLIGSGMSILCHVALRMVTQSGLDYFLQLKSSLRPTEHDYKFPPGSYQAVYNLVTHADRRPPQDFLQRTLMAIFLLKCLQRTTFFTNPSQDQTTLNSDELFTASLLLHHLQLLQFNAHELYETRMEAADKFRGARAVYIGVGIYPSVALFNHDCYPAVVRYFVGRSIVIRAIRPLKAGEILAENYGPIFVKRTRAARQRSLLSRYWFRCECQACNEDWPMFETQNNHSFRLKCTTVGCKQILSIPQQHTSKSKQKTKNLVKCSSCKKQISLEQSLRIMDECEMNYAKGLDAMEDGDTAEAITLFCSYIDRMHAIGCPPHKDLHLCQEALRTCMANSGNKWIVPNSDKK